MFPGGARGDVGQYLAANFDSNAANSLVAPGSYPDLQKMILDQRQILDTDLRIEKVHEIQRLLGDAMPAPPQGVHIDSVTLYWRGLRGLENAFGWMGPFGMSAIGSEISPHLWLDEELRG